MSQKPDQTARCLLIFSLMFLLVVVGRTHAQKVDLNLNGMSDIWEQSFNASGLNPDADTDGDGVINRLESIAGTDPFDSNSVPRIADMSAAATNFSVTVPCVLGKQYQLQSIPAAVAFSGGTNWNNQPSVIVRA